MSYENEAFDLQEEDDSIFDDEFSDGDSAFSDDDEESLGFEDDLEFDRR